MQYDEHASRQGELNRWCRRLKLTVASEHVDEFSAEAHINGDEGNENARGIGLEASFLMDS